MTEITIYRDKDHVMTGFQLKGHTGFGDSGTDIVCAAVSTAAITCVNGLTEVLGIDVSCQSGEGFLKCVLPESLGETEKFGSGVLLDSMLLTMNELERQYSDHLKVNELEV